ncbi:MAG TPA: RidA family protein [Terriglobia bacterium]|nr:RidA family protein [Terriglobia bacterium]
MVINSRWSAFSSASMIVCALILGPVPGHAQENRAVNLPGASQSLPFSDGIVAGNTLYVAGQQGTDSKGKLKDGISEQTEATLEHIKEVVTKAGFQMKDVVTVNVYLSDVADFAAMNKVYTTFFPNPKPARTTIQAAGLVNGAKVEIAAIAVRQGSSR